MSVAKVIRDGEYWKVVLVDFDPPLTIARCYDVTEAERIAGQATPPIIHEKVGT